MKCERCPGIRLMQQFPAEGDSSMAAEKTDNQSPAINALDNMQRNQK